MGHSFQFSFRWGNNILWSIVFYCILVFRYNCVWRLTCTGWNMDEVRYSFSILLVCVRLVCRQSVRTHRFLLHSLFPAVLALPALTVILGHVNRWLDAEWVRKKKHICASGLLPLFCFSIILFVLFPLYMLQYLSPCHRSLYSRYSRLVNSVGPLFYLRTVYSVYLILTISNEFFFVCSYCPGAYFVHFSLPHLFHSLFAVQSTRHTLIFFLSLVLLIFWFGFRLLPFIFRLFVVASFIWACAGSDLLCRH